MLNDYQKYIQDTKAILPYGILHIEDYAFNGCTGLTSIEIPDSVTEIGHGAFWGCTGLTCVEIPDSVTGIGYGAFYGCKRLTSIKLHVKKPSEASALIKWTELGYEEMITVYTPIGTGYAYRHDEYFSKFKEVIPKL